MVLYGVVEADRVVPADLVMVRFRDLAVVGRPLGHHRNGDGAPAGAATPRSSTTIPSRTGEWTQLRAAEHGTDRATEHRGVVELLFKDGSVLPLAPGVVAKGADSVQGWLELHYVTLSEAMAFVEGRCAARVHVTRAPSAASTERPLDAPPLDLDGVAMELFRNLRRHAAASVTLRMPGSEADEASAAFLVESERWRLFADAVAVEGKRDATLRVTLTGPWPPYDFVKMQFGG